QTCALPISHPSRHRINQQSGAIHNDGFVAILFKFCAQRRGTPVLPHDGVMDGLAGFSVPDDRGFTLIGDSDTDNLLRVEPGTLQGTPAHCERTVPDLQSIMLDPTILRKILMKFLLSYSDLSSCVIKYDGSGTGCTLIDGKQITRHYTLLLCSGDSNSKRHFWCEPARIQEKQAKKRAGKNQPSNDE